MKRKAYHHGNLKEVILKEALATVEKEGEALVSMRELASRANVTHAAVYRHFKSRTEIFATLALSGFRKLQAAFVEAVARPSTKSPLRCIGEAYVHFALENSGYFKVMFNAELKQKEAFPELAEVSATAFASLVSAIEAGAREGKYRAAPVPQMALSAWSSVHGLSSLLLDGLLEKPIEEMKIDRERIIEAIAQMAEKALQ